MSLTFVGVRHNVSPSALSLFPPLGLENNTSPGLRQTRTRPSHRPSMVTANYLQRKSGGALLKASPAAAKTVYLPGELTHSEEGTVGKVADWIGSETIIVQAEQFEILTSTVHASL